MLDNRATAVRFRTGTREFSLPPNYPGRFWVLPSYIPMGAEVFLLGVKRSGGETDLSVARLRMSDAIPPRPYMPFGFYRNIFTFTS